MKMYLVVAAIGFTLLSSGARSAIDFGEERFKPLHGHGAAITEQQKK